METLDDDKIALHIFERMELDEINKYFIDDESVPFKYCELMLKRKKAGHYVGDDTLAFIARRSDCPLKLSMSICKSLCHTSSYFSKLLMYKFKDKDEYRSYGYESSNWKSTVKLREKVQQVIFEYDQYKYSFAGYWRLADSLKAQVSDHFMKKVIEDVSNHNSFGIDNDFDMLSCFVQNQPWLPDESMEKLLKLIDARFHTTWIVPHRLQCLKDRMFLMLYPLEDSVVEEELKKSDAYSTLDFKYYAKIAANASISDYAMMELLMKCPPEYTNDLSELVDSREKARKAYRREHGEH